MGNVDLVHESTATPVFTHRCISRANLSSGHMIGGPQIILRVLINYEALYHNYKR